MASTTSPMHSPIPSSANAPRPKGILKNSNERSASFSQTDADSQRTQPSAPTDISAFDSDGTRRTHDAEGNRLQWDETNLTLNEIDRENTEARMKIDEPKTPFVHGRGLDGEDGMDFDLDGSAPSTPSTGLGLSGGRRSSAAEQLAANTSANALLGKSSNSQSSQSGSNNPAIGLDDAALASSSTASTAMEVDGANAEEEEGPYHPARLRSDSRSPSFSLSSRRSSSSRSGSSSGGRPGNNGVDGRSGVREESRGGNDNEEALEDDEEMRDPETQAKHDEFARKRNMHYGNEAEAMKIAAALAAKEDEEDDDDNDEGGSGAGVNGIPPVPPLPRPNGA